MSTAMYEAFVWSSFLIAITLLTLSPGVDTLLVLRRTAVGGLASGLMASLGICCGLFFHALLSALGLSLLIISSEYAYTLLRFAGAFYLVWLGLQALYSAYTARRLSPDLSVDRSQPLIQSFYQGLLSNLLNPKTLVFYLAFLPQFIHPDYPALGQSLMMAAIHFVLAMTWQSAIALGVGSMSRWLLRPAVIRAIDLAVGAVFLILGTHLALSPVSLA